MAGSGICCSDCASASAVMLWDSGTARGATSHRASATRTTVTTAAVMFHQENVVSETGMT